MLFTLVFSLLFGFPTHCSADSNLYEVLDIAYCKGVEENTPVGIFHDTARIRTGQALYCWTKIRVLPGGVQMLRSLGRLPVRHSWIRDGMKVFTATDPSITQTQWQKHKEKIEWMVSQSKDGSFEWRTASCVRRDSESGLWRVSAVDANGRLCCFRGKIELPTIRIEVN
jgi:hypothetical protein